jgi:hypothetical protein
MCRRLGLLCAALAMFSIAGGHWAVAQTVAWGQMLRDYTQRNGSFTVAVEQTFDGQHPCELCREIDAAKAQENQTDNPAQKPFSDQQKTVKSDKDKLFPLEDHSPLARLAADDLRWLPAPSLDATARAERPPTPPPRAILS